jgi:hypothetical protein
VGASVKIWGVEKGRDKEKDARVGEEVAVEGRGPAVQAGGRLVEDHVLGLSSCVGWVGGDMGVKRAVSRLVGCIAWMGAPAGRAGGRTWRAM